MFRFISGFFSVILVIKGAISQDNCCKKKIVKDVSYKLVKHSGLNPDPSCINSCIYQEESNPSSHFCFKEGAHQAECYKEVCPGEWDYWEKTGKCYKMFKNELTWMEAQFNCTSLGGNLALIHDYETNNFLSSLSGGVNTWLGLRRIGPQVDPKPRNDQWTWIDGSPIVGNGNWLTGQPDNAHGGDEFCGMMNMDEVGKWNDAPCEDWYEGWMQGYVCQI